MAFDDLTDDQRELAISLVAALDSGAYSSEFAGIQKSDGSWLIELIGLEGVRDGSIDDVEESDLEELDRKGYITLRRKKLNYFGSLEPKAHQQYENLRESTIS